MMLWEIGWCVAGFNRLKEGEKPDPISDKEFDEELRKAGLH